MNDKAAAPPHEYLAAVSTTTGREACGVCGFGPGAALHALQLQSQPVFDPVSKPAHYNQGGVECIDALKAATINLTGTDAVCTANAIKYLWCWKQKNGVQDLEEALWYIERLIKENTQKK